MDKIIEEKKISSAKEKWFQHHSLADRPHLLKKTVDLIEQCLGYEPQNSFLTDFAPLFHKDNLKNCLVLVDKEESVLAHVGMIKKELNWNKQISIPISLFGGICVHPNYRGKGLFRHLFEKALLLNSTEVALSLLWSDKPDLYHFFGFHHAIGQIELPMIGNRRSHFEKTKYSFLDNKEKQIIKTLYQDIIQKKYVTTKRTDSDWANIEKISSADLYLKRNTSGQISGYFFMNKGQDLKGIIHELCLEGLELDESLQFGCAWLTEIESTTYPLAPLRHMALVRAGQMEAFSKFVSLWTEGKVLINKMGQEKVVFTFNDQIYTENISEFLSLLLGPHPAQEFMSFFKPIYISGLDSI